MSKVKALRNFFYDGMAYKAGEEFELVGYSFTWLTEKKCVAEVSGKQTKARTAPELPAVEDDLVVTDGLPSLDDEPKRRKKS